MEGKFVALLCVLSLVSLVSCHGDFVYVPVVSIPYSAHPAPPITAVAELRTNGDGSGEGEVKGRIVFVQPAAGGPVFMFGNITGLTEGQHGFHIHEYGDISDGCKSMGGHFNPHLVSHGGPADLVRHVGDLGNVKADGEGLAKVSESDWAISLMPGAIHNIIGRGLVVHAGMDDLGRGGDNESLRTGNAGDRVACGVIALAAPRYPNRMDHSAMSDRATKPPKR